MLLFVWLHPLCANFGVFTGLVWCIRCQIQSTSCRFPTDSTRCSPRIRGRHAGYFDGDVLVLQQVSTDRHDGESCDTISGVRGRRRLRQPVPVGCHSFVVWISPSLAYRSWAQWRMANSLLLATIFRTGFVIISYGSKVPAGIFVPSMAIGATFGRMVGIIVKSMYR